MAIPHTAVTSSLSLSVNHRLARSTIASEKIENAQEMIP
jgi:hypothetical protein